MMVSKAFPHRRTKVTKAARLCAMQKFGSVLVIKHLCHFVTTMLGYAH
jgi:hypothetical protein